MPAPWGPKPPTFPRPKIERVVDRCLTLRQLRELQEFVQRLCKAGLLRYPDEEPYKTRGCANQIIKWTCINQYEITSQIIKRVIPRDSSCSWVELVADGCPQRVRYFCSHFWGEAFRDFVATIEGHAREHRVRQHEAYFVCVYANDQHQVQLGRCLQDSPFYHALQSAEMTIVLLDKRAEALLRIWCVFEMHSTMVVLKKPLEVWTPQGRVGSPFVSSGPAVTALTHLDTSKAQASRQDDKRRILNHIVGKPEEDGIQNPCEASAQALIRSHTQKFNDLDNNIRSCAVASLSQAAESVSYTAVRDMAVRGITLAQLRALAQEVKAALAAGDFRETDPSSPRSGERIEWDWANFYHVTTHVLRPQTKAKQCSYAELVAGGPQPPDFTVCLWWGCTFKDFLEALEWHAESRDLSDSAIYWAGPFAFNHWEAERQTAVAAERVQETVLYKMAKTKSLGANGVLLVLDRNLVVMSRLWPMLEAHLGIRYGRSIDLGTWSGTLATTRPFPGNAWEYGSFDEEVADLLLSFNVVQCRALLDGDRRMILNFIAGKDDDPSKAPPRGCKGYDDFDQRFRAKAAGPALRAAAFQGNAEMIEVVVEACPGLSFSRQGLCGALGETPLHAAAAAGHPDIVSRLLELESDVNAQDVHGETPLHYSALTGRGEVAALLVQKRADPLVESFAAETPLQVAQQSACKFLGVDTRSVVWALEQSEGVPAPRRAVGVRASKALDALQGARSRRREELKSLHWDHFREEESKVEGFMAKLVAKQDTPRAEAEEAGSRRSRRSSAARQRLASGSPRHSLPEDEDMEMELLRPAEQQPEVLSQVVSYETFGMETIADACESRAGDASGRSQDKKASSRSGSASSSRPSSKSSRRRPGASASAGALDRPPIPAGRMASPISPTAAMAAQSSAHARLAGVALPDPNTAAVAFKDPRSGGTVGLIAFYFPGKEEVWDTLCASGFLANFWDLGKTGLKLKAPVDRVEKSFANSEAAFQALKWWDKADSFRDASGSEAHKLKKQLAGSEDWSYAGFGHSWAAMLAVVRAKFAPGTVWAEALLKTGDCYLLEHSGVAGRESLWSDNSVGDGSNWLGLQLMLRRDELLEGAGKKPLWTPFLQGTCQLDAATGKNGSPKGKDAWQATVQAAAKAISDRVASLPPQPRAAAPQPPPAPPTPTGVPAAPSVAAATLGPICKRPGCGKPTYNGKPNEFCSKSCSNYLPALPPAHATRPPPKPQCMRPGCGKPTWNGQPNEFCSKACKGLAARH